MRTEPRLRLDWRFTHVVSADDTVVLVRDDDSIVFNDPLFRDAVVLLDGRRTAVAVAETLRDRHAPENVHYLLLRLQDEGLVVDVHADAEDSPPVDGLAGALRRTWLEGAGRSWVPVPTDVWEGPSGCRLIITDDYLHSWPDSWSRAWPTAPTLLAKVGAGQVWLGPVLGAGASCAACLQDRLLLNLTGRALVHAPPSRNGSRPRVTPLPPRVPERVWSILANRLPSTPEEFGALARSLRVVALDAGADHEDHPVPRLPPCPVCGDPSLTVPGADLALRSRRRSGATGGGYRVVDAAETLARHGHLVSPLTGVVRRIRRVPVQGAEGVHVYTASHAHHYGVGNVRTARDDLRDHSGGKGRNAVDARASALCESLERFSSVHRGDEPMRTARRSEMGVEALEPNALLHYSPAQYAGRESWNRSQAGGFQQIPEPYDDEPIAWSPVRDLADGTVRFVPTGFLYYGFRGPGERFCDGDSNGLAAGNCLEEAILQGFLEVVERDAVALWWYNRVPRPAVDLERSGDAWLTSVVAFYASLGRDAWALDLTNDLAIPTYAAVSAVRREAQQEIIFGFGSHLDPGIALSRAFSEMNQMLSTVLQSPEERRRRLLPDFAEAVRWWDEVTLATDAYLFPALDLPPVSLPHGPPSTGDLLTDIDACVSRATAVGCAVLVHDLTRPDVGLPVAKVVVPGLRHFWRRLGPGRLYEVPVALGWLPRPLAEDELNPASVFV